MGAAVLCDPVLIHTHILSETSCKMTRQNYPQNDRTPAKLSQLLICWNTHDAMNTLSSETRPPQRSQRSPQTYPRPSRCQSDEPIPDWEPDPDCPGDCDYPADSDDPTSTSTSTRCGRTSGTSTIAPASAAAQQQHSRSTQCRKWHRQRHRGKAPRQDDDDDDDETPRTTSSGWARGAPVALTLTALAPEFPRDLVAVLLCVSCHCLQESPKFRQSRSRRSSLLGCFSALRPHVSVP
jgi:hypothetical protein